MYVSGFHTSDRHSFGMSLAAMTVLERRENSHPPLGGVFRPRERLRSSSVTVDFTGLSLICCQPRSCTYHVPENWRASRTQ
jgi:hypothetical protein